MNLVDEPTLRACDIVAFIAITNPAKAKAFYQGQLGLELQSEDQFALQFNAHGIALRLAKVPTHNPLPFAILSWKVRDIAAVVRELVEAGVKFERFEGFKLDDLGIWTAPDGTQVAWFKDPDENMLSLTQFAGIFDPEQLWE